MLETLTQDEIGHPKIRAILNKLIKTIKGIDSKEYRQKHQLRVSLYTIGYQRDYGNRDYYIWRTEYRRFLPDEDKLVFHADERLGYMSWITTYHIVDRYEFQNLIDLITCLPDIISNRLKERKEKITYKQDKLDAQVDLLLGKY